MTVGCFLPLFWYVVPDCKPDLEVGPSQDHEDDDGKQTLGEAKQDITETNEGTSHNRNTRKEKFGPEHSSNRRGSILNEKSSVNAGASEAGTNVGRKLKLATECYQLKVHRANDDDFKQIVTEFHERRTQSVLERIKFTEDQWRTLDLQAILSSVNPRPIMMFDGGNILNKDGALPENTPDDVTFRRSSALCCDFEDLIEKFGWTAGNSLDIEDDICNVISQLIMKVNEEDMSNLTNCIQNKTTNIQAQGRERNYDEHNTHMIAHKVNSGVIGKVTTHVISSVLDCLKSAMLKIQAFWSERDDDKLRSLLIKKKKYNGLNLACILLEQMILDNKDNNVSWMRKVCSQFIDLVCQLIIEPDYQEDVHSSLRYQEDVRWTLNYLLKLESKWTVWDIYNLMKNGILMFQDRPEEFHQNLVMIRNLAIHPSVKVRLSNNEAPVSFEEILHCRDENKWTFLAPDVELHEDKEKTLELVLSELDADEVGQEEQESMKKIIEKSKQKLGEDKNTYTQEIEQELKLIKNWTQTNRGRYNDKYEQEIDRELKNLEEKDGFDLLPTCIALTSMALKTCGKKFKPFNTQLVSYCLLVARKNKDKGRLLEILTGEGKSCVIAMVAATYALQGRTVDIVTSSPVLSQRDAKEWQEFYSSLKLDVGCNVENNSEEDSQCYKCPIVYGTVETFARDILKTKFLLQLDVRKDRKCDIVTVDEVDSMLIDQGVQCTYLSHDVASIGLHHFEPILSLIWLNISRFVELHDNGDRAWYRTEQELFFFTLCRISNDPLHILHRVEQKGEIMSGFTNKYVGENLEGQIQLLRSLSNSEVKRFFLSAREYLDKDINIYAARDVRNGGVQTGISILVYESGLSSVVLAGEEVKKRLTTMITDIVSNETDAGINLSEKMITKNWNQSP